MKYNCILYIHIKTLISTTNSIIVQTKNPAVISRISKEIKLISFPTLHLYLGVPSQLSSPLTQPHICHNSTISTLSHQGRNQKFFRREEILLNKF